MTRICVLRGIRPAAVCGALGCLMVLLGCSDSQNPPGRLEDTLGGVKEGAPLAAGPSDPGVFQDITQYQAVRGTGGSSGGTRKKGGGDAQLEIRRTLQDLINAINSSDPSVALRMFNSAHVQALSAEKLSAISPTFDKLEDVRKQLTTLSDQIKADQLIEALRPTMPADPRIELADQEHGSVKTDVMKPIFGPDKTPPALNVAVEDNEWKFQLGAPLTPADVDAIVAYHTQLQKSLDQIFEWLSGAATLDEAKFKTVFAQAVAGKPVDIGESAGGEKPAGETAPGGEPNQPAEGQPPPPAPGGRHRPLPPPGGGEKQPG